jgi:hypothetical protein
VLELVLELALTQAGGLDGLYCALQPLERAQANLPHLLSAHLGHPANAPLLPALLARCAASCTGAAALRLLRLLCAPLFQGGLYAERGRIARGAYAQARAHAPCWRLRARTAP